MAELKKKPKLDPKRAARFVWTEGQFTIEKASKTKIKDTKKK